MIMISFAPTSRSDIRPSGETFDLVKPGISRVVARILGVEIPDIPILPGLFIVSAGLGALFVKAYMWGLPGADGVGVSVNALP